MSFAFKPLGGEWVEIEQGGTRLQGGGEDGEDVIVSHAFVESLPFEMRDDRGFIEVAEVAQPEGEIVVGWTVQDVDGVPTRVWTIQE
jgi:hypothetical protein